MFILKYCNIQMDYWLNCHEKSRWVIAESNCLGHHHLHLRPGGQKNPHGRGWPGNRLPLRQERRATGGEGQQEFAKFSQQNTHSVEQIPVTTYTGTRTRIDAMGIDLNGDIVMREFKSSASAPLTRNQRKAFQEIKENG